MQHRQLGSLPSFKLEAASPNATAASRLKKLWESDRSGKIPCVVWSFVLLNIVWFAFLVISILYSIGNSNDNSTSAMSLGQQSAWVRRSNICAKLNVRDELWAGDLREFEGAWNRLCFGGARSQRLRIAAFVKTWPMDGKPGGMEHHASTLYHDLARRGHELHVFTTRPNGENITLHKENRIHVHIVRSPRESEVGYSAEKIYWQTFLALNASGSPFDVVHTESFSLAPRKANGISPTAATWHGIAAECIHSDIAMERHHIPKEPPSEELQWNLVGRLKKIVEETKMFDNYGHHIAISDYVADVMRTIYEFPVERVHTIFNGVDDAFHPNSNQGAAFRRKYNVPADATMVFGVAGRLVKDKGHPLLYDAFVNILERHSNVYLLVAGSGPWLSRYARLAPGKPNVVALGPLPPDELNGFYNALDVFVNPTLRSQGLDTTLIEALQCGKALMATRFASITWSVIIGKQFGFTFAPNVEAVTAALDKAIRDGRKKMRAGAETRVEYARMMFKAAKMGAAYERLFLCLSDDAFCAYPLPTDRCPDRETRVEN